MTDTRNRHLKTPAQFLPDIGQDVPIWLQNFLIEVKSKLEAIYVDADPPGQPTNLIATGAAMGVALRWNPASKARAYKLFRGTTSVFTDAQLITVLLDNQNVSFLDVGGVVGNYYWVRGQSASLADGPLSQMATAV